MTTSETQGFFTTSGALKSESTTASRSASTADAPPSQAVVDQAAKITDDAVYTETSKLNVGGTGYDSGVSSLVNEAVTAALQKIGSRSASSSPGTSPPAFVGGTYQNEILSKKEGVSAPPTTPLTPPADGGSTPTVPPPTNPVDGSIRHGRGRGSGNHSPGSGRGRRRASINKEA